MWTVYIIECEDGSLYTGITTDVQRRFQQHKSGKGGHYTRSHQPIKIVYTEVVENRSAASIREAAIKKLSAEEKRRLVN